MYLEVIAQGAITLTVEHVKNDCLRLYHQYRMSGSGNSLLFDSRIVFKDYSGEFIPRFDWKPDDDEKISQRSFMEFLIK